MNSQWVAITLVAGRRGDALQSSIADNTVRLVAGIRTNQTVEQVRSKVTSAALVARTSDELTRANISAAGLAVEAAVTVFVPPTPIAPETDEEDDSSDFFWSWLAVLIIVIGALVVLLICLLICLLCSRRKAKPFADLDVENVPAGTQTAKDTSPLDPEHFPEIREFQETVKHQQEQFEKREAQFQRQQELLEEQQSVLALLQQQQQQQQQQPQGSPLSRAQSSDLDAARRRLQAGGASPFPPPAPAYAHQHEYSEEGSTSETGTGAGTPRKRRPRHRRREASPSPLSPDHVRVAQFGETAKSFGRGFSSTAGPGYVPQSFSPERGQPDYDQTPLDPSVVEMVWMTEVMRCRRAIRRQWKAKHSRPLRKGEFARTYPELKQMVDDAKRTPSYRVYKRTKAKSKAQSGSESHGASVTDDEAGGSPGSRVTGQAVVERILEKLGRTNVKEVSGSDISITLLNLIMSVVRHIRTTHKSGGSNLTPLELWQTAPGLYHLYKVCHESPYYAEFRAERSELHKSCHGELTITGKGLSGIRVPFDRSLVVNDLKRAVQRELEHLGEVPLAHISIFWQGDKKLKPPGQRVAVFGIEKNTSLTCSYTPPADSNWGVKGKTPTGSQSSGSRSTTDRGAMGPANGQSVSSGQPNEEIELIARVEEHLFFGRADSLPGGVVS
ncbi:hypothetical protein DIPPA_29532 [Diplonema papillatum]|nr:hypothetical protein DIPPA_29532 [Diplonema papillatum]